MSGDGRGADDRGAEGYDAIVLAGGEARRLGGADKPAVRVGGRTLLDRVLTACADAGRTVVVGPRRPTCRPVTWAREDPPGGGPLAALHAGLRLAERERVVVLAADLPFLTAGTVWELREHLDLRGSRDLRGHRGHRESRELSEPPQLSQPGVFRGAPPPAAETGAQAQVEGVLLTDPGGRDQPLTAAYRAEPLRRELALLAAEHGRLGHLPLRLLLPGLVLRRVPGPAGLDCDTWADIAAARARIREHGTVLDEWIAAVKDELSIDTDVDSAVLLDAARDAAHGVARPAAPLTTFLIGYAAAKNGTDVAVAARRVAALAARWEQEQEEPS